MAVRSPDYEFGNFTLDMLRDSDDEFLSTIDLGDLFVKSLETVSGEELQIEKTPVEAASERGDEQPKPKRFKALADDEINNIEGKHQSTSTKKNTQWGKNLFQDWHKEVNSEELNLYTVTKDSLAEKLRKFYCEATPKRNVLPAHQANEYHRNTLINIRSAIYRFLKDIERNMDIVRDTEFTKSIRTFDGHLKSRTESGISRPTQHKEIISCEDLKKISDYLQGHENSPVILREAAWYLIAIHFVTRGMEFHYQLRKDSIVFREDSEGEFLILNQETKEKNNQGGANKKSLLSENRIYATEGLFVL